MQHFTIINLLAFYKSNSALNKIDRMKYDWQYEIWLTVRNKVDSVEIWLAVWKKGLTV